jgi:hypothetical protein
MPSHPSPTARGRRLLAAGTTALAILALVPAQAVAGATIPHADGVDRPRVGAAIPATMLAGAGGASAAPTGRALPTRARRQDEVLRFVYVRDDRTTTMSGTIDDVARARRYRRSGEPLLWFRHEGREYVVRDPNVLREVDALWEPVTRIGAEQGRLGSRQGALGAEQGRYGARQGEIGAKQGVIGARQGVIGARQARLALRERDGASAAERHDVDRERAALEREMRELEREMATLGEEMRAVTPPREVGDEMAALGRRMEVLGAQMADASRTADAGMRRLVDRAIRSGAAEAVR